MTVKAAPKIDVASLDQVALELAARLFEKIWSPQNTMDPRVLADKAFTAAEHFAAEARSR